MSSIQINTISVRALVAIYVVWPITLIPWYLSLKLFDLALPFLARTSLPRIMFGYCTLVVATFMMSAWFFKSPKTSMIHAPMLSLGCYLSVFILGWWRLDEVAPLSGLVLFFGVCLVAAGMAEWLRTRQDHVRAVQITRRRS